MATFTQRITDTTNDGYNYSSTTFYDGLGFASSGPQVAGARFVSVPLPTSDVTINSATLTVETRFNGPVGLTGKLFGVPGSCPAFVSGGFIPLTAPRTTAYASISSSTAGTVINYDVTSIVEEVIANGSWALNGAIGFIFTADTGGTAQYYYEVNDDSAKAALLTIDYTVGPPEPVITSPSTVNVPEQTQLSFEITCTKTISSITKIGGADQSKFQISGSTLQWTGNIVKDYASPDDSDTNNSYIVQIRVTDTDAMTVDQTITFSVYEVAKANIVLRDPGSNFNIKLSDVIITDYLYLGANWSARYLGSRSDASLYLGTKTLHP